MRLPNTRQQDNANHYIAKDNDDFISSESDRQMLLIRYPLFWFLALFSLDVRLFAYTFAQLNDAESIFMQLLPLDNKMRSSMNLVQVWKGLDLSGLPYMMNSTHRYYFLYRENHCLFTFTSYLIIPLQEKLIDELGSEMDSTSTRLDFVQVSHPLVCVGYVMFCKLAVSWKTSCLLIS